MNHVMVPVPEEHLDRVRQYVAWRDLRRRAPDLDPSVARAVVAVLDEPTRQMLADVIRLGDHLVDRETSIDALAARIGVSAREIVGLITEINGTAAAADGPSFLFAIQPLPIPDDAGVSWTSSHHLELLPGVAAALGDALADAK